MRYRYYFLEALFITLLIFFIGFIIGYTLENNRNLILKEYYSETEDSINSLFEEIDKFNLNSSECETLIEKGLELGDRIYRQALIFEKYETSAILTTNHLIEEHKKFDLLRTLYWANLIDLKKYCNGGSNTLVYLYDYRPKKIKDIAKQKTSSTIASEIKVIFEDDLILIPIAKNLNISYLDKLIEMYEIPQDTVFFIANEEKIFKYGEMEEIKDYFSRI